MHPAEGVQMIPCIVLMKTRSKIKILIMITQDRVTNSKGQFLECLNHINSESKRKDSFYEAASNILSTNILESSDNKWQFSVPLEKNKYVSGRENGVINFEKTRVIKIIDGVEEIIKLSHTSNEKISNLIEGADYCRRSMIILRKKIIFFLAHS